MNLSDVLANLFKKYTYIQVLEAMARHADERNHQARSWREESLWRERAKACRAAADAIQRVQQ